MTGGEELGGGVTLFAGDWRTVIGPGRVPGVDAVITDPPYGMAWDTDSTRYTGGNRALRPVEGRGDWSAVAGDAEPFDPTPWLAYPRVVLFGAHHYAARLPVGTTLIWIKKADHLFGTFLSDADTAWMKGGYGVYCYRRQFPPSSRAAETAGGRVGHPTQKPIDLMRWCVRKAKVPAGGLILDPYAGSGTTALAAIREGCRCVLVEKDPRYCDVIRRRVREACDDGLFATAGATAKGTGERPDLFAGVTSGPDSRPD